MLAPGTCLVAERFASVQRGVASVQRSVHARRGEVQACTCDPHACRAAGWLAEGRGRRARAICMFAERRDGLPLVGVPIPGGRSAYRMACCTAESATMCVNGSSVRPRAKLLFMRSQTYGDKQREAQRRKKQEELRKKSNPESAPPSGTATNADKSDQAPNKTKKEGTPVRGSA